MHKYTFYVFTSNLYVICGGFLQFCQNQLKIHCNICLWRFEALSAILRGFLSVLINHTARPQNVAHRGNDIKMIQKCYKMNKKINIFIFKKGC